MKDNTLRHLAIIMDGNGRWASQKGLARTDGHREGAKVVREITMWCAQNHIEYLSLYAFSTENWQRPKIEVDFLMRLLEKYLKNEEKTYTQNGIKFRAIGDISIFSPKLQKLIKSLESKTAQNTALTHILALNYGAKDEVARAIMKMQSLGDSRESRTDLAESRDFYDSINRDSLESRGDLVHSVQNLRFKNKAEILEIFESCLDTAGIPPVDLLVRTGGEMRLSNFLLYQCAYAELFFTQTLFPDFNVDELREIISAFKRRHRRFGEL